MSTNKSINRRDILKLAGLGGMAAMGLPLVKIVGREGDDVFLASEEKYGGFLIRKLASDVPPYEVDDSRYQRFNAKNNMYCRSLWDQPIFDQMMASFKDPMIIMKENKPGFRKEDWSLLRASWSLSAYNMTDSGGSGKHLGFMDINKLEGNFFDVAGGLQVMIDDPVRMDDRTPEELTEIAKKASLFLGASMVGIAPLDERWVLTHYFNDTFGNDEGDIIFEDSPKPYYNAANALVIPKSMKNVVVLIFEMDHDAEATAQSAIGSAAPGNGYSRMAFTAGSVAEFIRGLGYQAIPSGNNAALGIPQAIDAGLGELGRNGLLITPKYGPRVRIAKVFTDMPLIADSPIRFGVTEFCDICKKCADNCPGKAISVGPRTMEPNNISNNPGVLKWPIDPEKCYFSFFPYGGFLDCGQCIRSCPFNKPEGWLHDATRILIGAQGGSIDQILKNLDDASGYGQKMDAKEFWNSNHFIHIKD